MYSRMSFVDLAGVELVSNYAFEEFASNAQYEQLFFHNSDLQALAHVIHCLSDQSFEGDVPYTESVLTRLLKVVFII